MHEELSPRERAVGSRLLAGKPLAVIAQELGIATTTVKSHAKSIYLKAGVRNAREYAAQMLGGLRSLVLAGKASAVDVLQAVDAIREQAGLERLT